MSLFVSPFSIANANLGVMGACLLPSRIVARESSQLASVGTADEFVQAGHNVATVKCFSDSTTSVPVPNLVGMEEYIAKRSLIDPKSAQPHDNRSFQKKYGIELSRFKSWAFPSSQQSPENQRLIQEFFARFEDNNLKAYFDDLVHQARNGSRNVAIDTFLREATPEDILKVLLFAEEQARKISREPFSRMVLHLTDDKKYSAAARDYFSPNRIASDQPEELAYLTGQKVTAFLLSPVMLDLAKLRTRNIPDEEIRAYINNPQTGEDLLEEIADYPLLPIRIKAMAKARP